MFNTNGHMTQDNFNAVASKDLFRAIWIAKHMGVADTVMRAWVAAVLAVLKK
jgi:hypothetical protein